MSLFIDLSCSFLIRIASLIHLSTLLLSLSMTLAWSQSMTWLREIAWSVTADLFGSPASDLLVLRVYALTSRWETSLKSYSKCSASLTNVGLVAILTWNLVDTFTDVLWSVLVFGMHKQTTYWLEWSHGCRNAIYDNLFAFAPNLSGERRLDRPFRRRLQSKLKRHLNKGCFYVFNYLMSLSFNLWAYSKTRTYFYWETVVKIPECKVASVPCLAS